jgi:serine/threonine protein kinase
MLKKGGFGVIYKAKDNYSNKIVVIKTLKRKDVSKRKYEANL